jgi:hypothetical protein
MINWGDHFQVTATWSSAIRVSVFQPLAAGFRIPRPIPERLTPELPVPLPITCHPK